MNNSHGYGGPDRCDGLGRERDDGGRTSRCPRAGATGALGADRAAATPGDHPVRRRERAAAAGRPDGRLLGTIGFVAMSQSGPRAWFTAGMFLARVGRLRARQRGAPAPAAHGRRAGARREYLAYLAEVRGTIRDAAGRQREAALWDSPDPRRPTAIAAEGTRVWERTASDADFLQVRMGATSQPLCLTLEPPQTPPLAQLDPVAASALTAPVTHRSSPACRPRPRLRAWARVEVTGEQTRPARSPARSCCPRPRSARPRGPRRGAAGVPRGPARSGSGSSGCRTPSARATGTPSGRCG